MLISDAWQLEVLFLTHKNKKGENIMSPLFIKCFTTTANLQPVDKLPIISVRLLF